MAALAAVLILAAPASAAPAYTGTVSGGAPFTWTGGPLTGINAVGEPCNTTHQCEDTLLHVQQSGRLRIHWTAEGPGDQGWLGVTLYKSDAEGNPQGEPVADGGAFDNEGALERNVDAGDYIVTFSALLSANATYDADASVIPGAGAGGSGEPVEVPSDPDWYQDAGADWAQAYIDEEDGTKLHADVLRPKGLAPDVKTPVILSIGPYFNHSGQVGPAGPIEDADYLPFGPVGPSPRFADFATGANIFSRGYTFVMVDLRGFGGSSGCLDWAGPGEQADVKAAVEWAASQPWSSGKVGMYGKSYDGVTGLIGDILQPKGLSAVVSQEPVYDLYRYLYANGIRYSNSVLTPALYDLIEATPGTIEDDPEYIANGANNSARPGCEAQNWADQQDSNHESEYWKARDLISKAGNAKTPLFMTQGFIENNTKPDGTWDFFNAVNAPKRAWFGMWDHVRGNDRDGQGRLAMGREGWFDEVMRFYDQYLKGEQPSVADPTLAIQTSDGTWRGEEQWPPADVQTLTAPLKEGTYTDDAQTAGTGEGGLTTATPGHGVWTISKPLPYDAHIAGVPRLTVDVETQAPNANLAADVYDIDQSDNAILIHRQAHLLADSGQYSFDLYGNDWKLPAGHRIGVLITTSNAEWWQAAVPTFSDVTVKGGTVTLPFLTHARKDTIQGERSIKLDDYVASAPFKVDSDTIAEGLQDSFPLPGPLADLPPAGSNQRSEPAATTPASGNRAGARRRSTRSALRVRISRRGRVIVVSGKAASGKRLTVRLLRGRKTVALKRIKARGGSFKVSFRLKKAGLYRALVTTTDGGRRINARTKLVRLRG